MADISVSVRAYCKLFLHAAKYPHCAVNGVLLAEKSKSKDPKTLTFVDAIPLFHLNLSLSPMMEVALTQIDAYCKSHGLIVAGYYQANEHFKDHSPNAVAHKIGDRIHDYCNEAYVLMLDNQKMRAECIEEVYRVYHNPEGKWKEKDLKHTSAEGALETASALLRNCSHRALVDFDNHLDDIALDWRNTEVNELIDHST